MKIIFSVILIIAFALRFINLNSIPPSLNWDEVSIGYNAYSILETGKDEWEKFLPLSFQAFGDYKLPAYIYLDVPFIGIFGLNEMGVRLPSVLLGVGIVILIFLILKKLTNNLSLSLMGMFLASILPWLIIFSRVAVEANLALFLTTLSFYFLLLSFQKSFFLPFASIFLGLSIFSYNSSRVLVLPFLILVLIIFYKAFSGRKKEVIITATIMIFLILIASKQAIYIDSGTRYKWTTLLDEGAIAGINQNRGASHLQPILASLRYNKVTYFLTEASKNYISYFNPDFLFFNGGSNYQFSVPGSGLLYKIMLPLLLLGVVQTIYQKKKWQFFILGWLLIAPLPGSITRDAPHALRSIFLTIPLLILSIQGIDFINQFLKLKLSRILLIFLIIIFTLDTYVFWQNYSGDYVKNYSWSWQYGYKQASQYIQQNYANYFKIAITKKYGEPHEFLLFYLKYNPYDYQHDPNLVRYERSQWFWVDRFDKFEFINDWEIKEKLLGAHQTLLVTSPNNYPTGSRIVKTINFLNGQKAFDLVAID